jgi:hypothetical protein
MADGGDALRVRSQQRMVMTGGRDKVEELDVEVEVESALSSISFMEGTNHLISYNTCIVPCQFAFETMLNMQRT